METIVAAVAIVFRIILSEIIEQHFTPANGRFGIGLGLVKQLTSNFLFGNGLVLLLGVIVRSHLVNLWDDIICQLMRELIDMLSRNLSSCVQASRKT